MICTIGPYLLPDLVGKTIAMTPQMPLLLHENVTTQVLDMLPTGELDCAILVEPFPDNGLDFARLDDEPFMMAMPKEHPLAHRQSIPTEELKQETMVLLGVKRSRRCAMRFMRAS